jgi:hypothetical protein
LLLVQVLELMHCWLKYCCWSWLTEHCWLLYCRLLYCQTQGLLRATAAVCWI